MNSIFSKIINRDIPAYIIAEDKNNIAFLDNNPIIKGHTLVVPKKEIDYIFDLDDKSLVSLHIFAKKVALGIKKAISCVRIGTSVIGLEVPHAHIHLIPLNDKKDMNFDKEKIHLSNQEMILLANKIREKVNI